jgi:hypothetical protein
VEVGEALVVKVDMELEVVCGCSRLTAKLRVRQVMAMGVSPAGAAGHSLEPLSALGRTCLQIISAYEYQ